MAMQKEIAVHLDIDDSQDLTAILLFIIDASLVWKAAPHHRQTVKTPHVPMALCAGR